MKYLNNQTIILIYIFKSIAEDSDVEQSNLVISRSQCLALLNQVLDKLP